MIGESNPFCRSLVTNNPPPPGFVDLLSTKEELEFLLMDKYPRIPNDRTKDGETNCMQLSAQITPPVVSHDI